MLEMLLDKQQLYNFCAARYSMYIHIEANSRLVISSVFELFGAQNKVINSKSKTLKTVWNKRHVIFTA